MANKAKVQQVRRPVEGVEGAAEQWLREHPCDGIYSPGHEGALMEREFEDMDREALDQFYKMIEVHGL